MCGRIDFSKYFGGAGVYIKENFADKLKSAFALNFPYADLEVFSEIDSTNTRAKLEARERNGKTPKFFIAERQSAGRGRLGRSFLSEEGGLYMSYLSYPTLSVSDAIKLTAYAAVALCETVSELTWLNPKIKWVNDVFIGEKKLAGILTEGQFDPSGQCFEYAVLGIGVNISKVDFGELSAIATDLESECGFLPDITEIAVRLSEKLLRFEDSDASEYMQKYCELSMLSGRRVKVILPLGEYFATVCGINPDGSLKIICDSGEIKDLRSGDVSIKLN